MFAFEGMQYSSLILNASVYIYTTLQTIASKAGDSLNEIWKIDKVALLAAEALKQK